jgi:cyclopropane-fatty-acyl-phospholipid synthase
MSPPGITSPFIRKYIFPGGYGPALSEVLAATEHAELWVRDFELQRLHYALTLGEWLRRFRANQAAVVALYDERFYRMWEFYLVAAEEYFQTGRSVLFHLVVSADGDAVPLKRRSLLDAECALAATQEITPT